MKDETAAHGEGDESLEHFAAELTDAAYRVALKHGVGDKWLELQLDLWEALTQAIENRPSLRRQVWPHRKPEHGDSAIPESSQSKPRGAPLAFD